MDIVTINVPNNYLKCIEKLISLGHYNSRSQVCREALKDFLDKEKQFTDDIIPEQFEKIKLNQKL